jgi:hypothetical protein
MNRVSVLTVPVPRRRATRRLPVCRHEVGALLARTRVDPFSPPADHGLRLRPRAEDGSDEKRPEVIYALQGRAHAALAGLAREARGQGTVEYVGLILLVAVILAGVVKASGGLKDSTIAEAVIDKLKGAIDSVGEGD